MKLYRKGTKVKLYGKYTGVITEVDKLDETYPYYVEYIDDLGLENIDWVHQEDVRLLNTIKEINWRSKDGKV